MSFHDTIPACSGHANQMPEVFTCRVPLSAMRAILGRDLSEDQVPPSTLFKWLTKTFGPEHWHFRPEKENRLLIIQVTVCVNRRVCDQAQGFPGNSSRLRAQGEAEADLWVRLMNQPALRDLVREVRRAADPNWAGFWDD